MAGYLRPEFRMINIYAGIDNRHIGTKPDRPDVGLPELKSVEIVLQICVRIRAAFFCRRLYLEFVQ